MLWLLKSMLTHGRKVEIRQLAPAECTVRVARAPE